MVTDFARFYDAYDACYDACYDATNPVLMRVVTLMTLLARV